MSVILNVILSKPYLIPKCVIEIIYNLLALR